MGNEKKFNVCYIFSVKVVKNIEKGNFVEFAHNFFLLKDSKKK